MSWGEFSAAPTGPPPPHPKLPLVVGGLIGAFVPLLATLVPALLADGSLVGGFGVLISAIIALVGVGLLVYPPTRRWGTGILLGFCAMLVIGAGVCVVGLIVFLNTGG